jgi:hypothetical protein
MSGGDANTRGPFHVTTSSRFHAVASNGPEGTRDGQSAAARRREWEEPAPGWPLMDADEGLGGWPPLAADAHQGARLSPSRYTTNGQRGPERPSLR